MASSSSKQDVQRAPRFWNVAVNATKGLFNPPTRSVLGDVENVAPAPSPSDVERHRRVRRTTSTPALKASASTGNLRPEMADNFSPPLPLLFSYSSLSPSPRKMKSKATAAPNASRRPVISSPSLPKPLDSFEFPHPKLAYPLSPMPSPVGSTFSLKTPALQSSSKLPFNQTVSDDDVSADIDSFNDNRLVRRRTKSAPGVKLGNKRPFFSPALETARESEIVLSEPSTPMVIDIASPSIASPSSDGSLPSPPLETPKMSADYFSFSSPAANVASPRSFTSVKRKPVPLYTEPPNHDASAPSTPMASPYPGSPPTTSSVSDTVRGAGAGVLHTPLLPSSELILKSCNQSWTNGRGRNLLPIGQAHVGSSARRQHRRSVSEQGYGQMLSSDGNLGLPIPWFTTNANGSMTPLITPAEEQPPFSFSNALSAPPRILPQSPPQTPRRVQEDISAFSDNTSVRSSVSRSGGLSPLTDDEVDAIRTFLRRHATGHRERQRRKGNLTGGTHSRNLSIVSAEYDMHAQILESYATDEDEFFSLGESEDDADAESTMPMTASDANSMHAVSVESQEPEFGPTEMANEVIVADFDVETPVIGDEVATPIDAVNRGTFGYYDMPVVRRPRSHTESTETNGYIPSDGEFETRPALPSDWREGGTFGDVARKSLGNEAFFVDDEDCECAEHAADATLITAPPRSSSLYYRSSSDYTPQSDLEEMEYLRNSHQPLISRTMISDSESDRPLSSSSASVSLSASTSTGPTAFATGIGLAIIPPEHIAYFERFDKYEYAAPCSPLECEEEPEDDLEGSPTALGCDSSPPRSRRAVIYGNSYDRLQANLAHLQSQQEVTSQQRSTSVLRPALQINSTGAAAAAATTPQLPSPADTIATYPPQTFTFIKGRPVQKFSTPEGMHRGNMASASVSADEATPGENVRSFMNLTPNDSTPKRRVKLRQLFSRANLRAAAGRKALGESKP